MIKVLLAEYDNELLDLTTYVLRRERFIVVEATDGTTALRRWKADRPDIVVIDAALPGIDGYEVLRRIRQEDESCAAVLVGDRRSGHDVQRAFELGTDDFLAKPFEFRELIARMRAVLRRTRASADIASEPRVQIEGLSLEPDSYEVNWHGHWVRLTPTEFRILYLLATNVGHVVPASRIYMYVWGGDGGDANALRSHISHLRRKLNEIGGAAAGTITSVPAVGYILRVVAASVELPSALARSKNGTAVTAVVA